MSKNLIWAMCVGLAIILVLQVVYALWPLVQWVMGW